MRVTNEQSILFTNPARRCGATPITPTSDQCPRMADLAWPRPQDGVHCKQATRISKAYSGTEVMHDVKLDMLPSFGAMLPPEVATVIWDCPSHLCTTIERQTERKLSADSTQ